MQRLRQPPLLDRLEQVINRIQLECLDRVLVEGGGEDHVRNFDLGFLVDQAPHHFQAILAGHGHIQKHEVRLVLLNQMQRLDAIARLGYHMNLGVGLQQESQLRPRQRLVIYHDRRDRRGRPGARLQFHRFLHAHPPHFQ